MSASLRSRPQFGAAAKIRDVLFLPLLSAHGLVRDGINDVTVLRALVEHSEVLTQDHKGRQLVVHLMRSAPAELCDIAEIAAAVSSSSLSLGTGKTLTRWPSSPSWQLHVTALLMLEKVIAFNSRKTRSRLTSAPSATRPTIS